MLLKKQHQTYQQRTQNSTDTQNSVRTRMKNNKSESLFDKMFHTSRIIKHAIGLRFHCLLDWPMKFGMGAFVLSSVGRKKSEKKNNVSAFRDGSNAVRFLLIEFLCQLILLLLVNYAEKNFPPLLQHMHSISAGICIWKGIWCQYCNLRVVVTWNKKPVSNSTHAVNPAGFFTRMCECVHECIRILYFERLCVIYGSVNRESALSTVSDRRSWSFRLAFFFFLQAPSTRTVFLPKITTQNCVILNLGKSLFASYWPASEAIWLWF